MVYNIETHSCLPWTSKEEVIVTSMVKATGINRNRMLFILNTLLAYRTKESIRRKVYRLEAMVNKNKRISTFVNDLQLIPMVDL